MNKQDLQAIRERAERARVARALSRREQTLHCLESSCADIPALLAHIESLEGVLGECKELLNKCEYGCVFPKNGILRNKVSAMLNRLAEEMQR